MTLLEDYVESSVSNCIKFLREQIDLCLSKSRKYSVHTMVISFFMFMQSPSCSESLQEHAVLCLPHSQYLRKLIFQFGTSLNRMEQHVHFFKLRCNSLEEKDKIVILRIDEMYLKQNISYKRGILTGQAMNNTLAEANTVLAFFVSSAFSNFKEIVSLIPVKNLTGSELHEYTVNTLELLHGCGFRVLTVISDNNRVNRNMFTLLTKSANEYSFKLSPLGNEIYVMFDPVHILKCVRNNWINLKDSDKTFIFPSFDGSVINSNELCYAKFSDVRNLYRSELGQLVKLAPKLNNKSVFPSSIEKQNVNLAVNIFHETTHAALVYFGVIDTAMFVGIILKWWSIMNIKDPVKGVRKRNDLAHPFSSIDDE